MNYPESQQILEKINAAQKIVVNCHRGPDPDSIGSALAMYQALTKMGKEVTVVTPSTDVEDLNFLKSFSKIQTIDFSQFNFSDFNLFLAIDSSSWDQVSDLEESAPNIETVVIDHHDTNTKYGSINLVVPRSASAAEVVFKVFQDWEIEIDQEIATCLLTGIIGDTGVFRYPGVGPETLEIAMHLMRLGGDKDKIIFHLYRSYSVEALKFYSIVLANLTIDTEHKFAWSSIPFEEFSKHVLPPEIKSDAANMFFQGVAGTNFGFVIVEDKPDSISVSFRGRTDFDTSVVATELGGGGHKAASGARLKLPFKEAVAKVLESARKHSK